MPTGDASNKRIPFAEALRKCKIEIETLAMIAYDAFRHNETQHISEALVQKYVVGDDTLLERITYPFGVMKRHKRANGLYVYTFRHLTYQEFFVALHIQQLLLTQRDKLVPSVQAELQEATRYILVEPHPRNAMVCRFLSGLLSMPAVANPHLSQESQTAASTYFWSACITLSQHRLCTTLGIHRQNKVLQGHMVLLREALLTSEAFRPYLERQTSEQCSLPLEIETKIGEVVGQYTLPYAVQAFEHQVHCITHWTNCCNNPEMLHYFDFDMGNGKFCISYYGHISMY